MIATIRVGEPDTTTGTVCIYQKIATEKYGDSLICNRVEVPITANFEIWKSPWSHDWYFTIAYDNTRILMDLTISDEFEFYATHCWGE